MKPYAPACDKNKRPILDILCGYLSEAGSVLEIGSGTGQHAVFFAANMPWLNWITSDLAHRKEGIAAWLEEAGLPNLGGPLALDADFAETWQVPVIDAIFTANTLHIMPWETGTKAIAGSAALLGPGGQLLIYGPFNRDGRHVGRGNALFDAQLRADGKGQGLRDLEAVQQEALTAGLEPVAVHPMPANNFILAFQRGPVK